MTIMQESKKSPKKFKMSQTVVLNTKHHLRCGCFGNINNFHKENSKESGVYVIRPVPIVES